MQDVVAQYSSDEGSLSRKYTLTQSAEYYERFALFYADWKLRLAAIDFESLSQNGKVDYILLRNSIERDANALQQKSATYNSIKSAFKFEEKLIAIIHQRRRGVALDPPATAAAFATLKKIVQENQKEIEKAPLFSRSQSLSLFQAVNEYEKAVSDLILFYNEYDPAFTFYIKRPATDLDSALRQYKRYLETRKTSDPSPSDASDIVGDPIGRAGIIRSLEEEFISYSPEDLMVLANKEFAW